MVIPSPELVQAAVQKVLGEITANGWDSGVMFEQNIPETLHLEVQVLRDRYGNTRHFGMRDCTEQRASQKIQEEAPPALLRFFPGLEQRICALAVRIADEVGYVGACTVELMFKDGHFYLLEMNTRIQVEHPVTEAAHHLGGLCQGAPGWAGAGARLSGPLHPPGGDLQRAHRGDHRHRGRLAGARP
jgi:acetyl/propionyl-CoA carboxylase alpha subunit